MNSDNPLTGQVAVVTGATGGVAHGIAAEIARAGATTYLTGRDRGRLDALAAEIAAAGGTAVPVVCDHADDPAVASAFARIIDEAGRVDVLVNCVATVPRTVEEYAASFQPFWLGEPEIWDTWCDVGLRSHYVASIHAARQMVSQGSGLIVNVSAAAAAQYFGSVAYGVGKAALDRLTADAAIQLAEHGVAVISIWPGVVRTDLTKALEQAGLASLGDAEHAEFAGRAVVAMAADPHVQARSGHAYFVAALARDYGFTELDGSQPSLPTYGGVLQHEGER
jgi:dehydrogenase/reductase SDR family protein 1